MVQRPVLPLGRGFIALSVIVKMVGFDKRASDSFVSGYVRIFGDVVAPGHG